MWIIFLVIKVFYLEVIIEWDDLLDRIRDIIFYLVNN